MNKVSKAWQPDSKPCKTPPDIETLIKESCTRRGKTMVDGRVSSEKSQFQILAMRMVDAERSTDSGSGLLIRGAPSQVAGPQRAERTSEMNKLSKERQPESRPCKTSLDIETRIKESCLRRGKLMPPGAIWSQKSHLLILRTRRVDAERSTNGGSGLIVRDA
jgi:hypothetical protein